MLVNPFQYTHGEPGVACSVFARYSLTERIPASLKGNAGPGGLGWSLEPFSTPRRAAAHRSVMHAAALCVTVAVACTVGAGVASFHHPTPRKSLSSNNACGFGAPLTADAHTPNHEDDFSDLNPHLRDGDYDRGALGHNLRAPDALWVAGRHRCTEQSGSAGAWPHSECSASLTIAPGAPRAPGEPEPLHGTASSTTTSTINLSIEINSIICEAIIVFVLLMVYVVNNACVFGADQRRTSDHETISATGKPEPLHGTAPSTTTSTINLSIEINSICEAIIGFVLLMVYVVCTAIVILMPCILCTIANSAHRVWQTVRSKESIELAFAVIDRGSGSGELSREELSELCAELGHDTIDEVTQIMAMLDTAVTPEEFIMRGVDQNTNDDMCYVGNFLVITNALKALLPNPTTIFYASTHKSSMQLSL